jgi:signal transduction histidine kinase
MTIHVPLRIFRQRRLGRRRCVRGECMVIADSETLRYVDPAQALQTQRGFSEQERAILETVNQKIAARDSLEAVIDFLFESTRSISPCDRIGTAFLDEDGRIVSHYVKAAYEPLLLAKGYAEDLSHGSLRAVLERGWPRIINDLEQYLAEHPESPATKLLVREGVRSSLTCPLTVEGRVVGVMFRSARHPGAYDDRQVAFHLTIAERLSQAVEKTRQIEQLRTANQAYFELLGFVSHELKSPVASMVTNARLLDEGYLGALQPKQTEFVRRMISAGEYLLSLIREYLDLARLEGGDLDVRPVKDADFVEMVVAPSLAVIQPQLEAKGMKLTRDEPGPPPRVEVDPELLKIVLINLLGNAIKYGDEGGAIRLRVEAKPESFLVSVWNQGPGFPESERPRLFRKFSRLRSPRLLKEKGTGVGLYTVWRVIKLHGGRVWARSEPDAWAEFGFEIPQPLPAVEGANANSGGRA